MYRAQILPILVIMFVFVGCTSMDVPDLLNSGAMEGRFDPAGAAHVLGPGSATIRGVFYRQTEAGVVPGKFATIKLIPDTPYAREHLERLFRGECAYVVGRQVLGIDPRYNSHMRVTNAGPDGAFEIHGVPDGDYVVYAYRTTERVYFAHRASITVAGQRDIVVDVGCNNA